MFEIIINVLFWIGILMLFCIICAILGIIIESIKISKGKPEGIWITKLKKDARDFIEKGI